MGVGLSLVWFGLVWFGLVANEVGGGSVASGLSWGLGLLEWGCVDGWF